MRSKVTTKETRRKLVFASLDAQERYHEACIACARAERAFLRSESRSVARRQEALRAESALNDPPVDFGESRVRAGKAYVLATHAEDKASAAEQRAWDRYIQATKARDAAFAVLQAASTAVTDDMKKAAEAVE